jgi:hypothetical protein
MKVICINDSHRPNDIPTSKWIVKDNEYTVIKVGKMMVQGGILGFQLAEVSLEGCAPYKYYAASRFRIKEVKPEEELEKELEPEPSELEIAY